MQFSCQYASWVVNYNCKLFFSLATRLWTILKALYYCKLRLWSCTVGKLQVRLKWSNLFSIHKLQKAWLRLPLLNLQNLCLPIPALIANGQYTPQRHEFYCLNVIWVTVIWRNIISLNIRQQLSSIVETSMKAYIGLSSKLL